MAVAVALALALASVSVMPERDGVYAEPKGAKTWISRRSGRTEPEHVSAWWQAITDSTDEVK